MRKYYAVHVRSFPSRLASSPAEPLKLSIRQLNRLRNKRNSAFPPIPQSRTSRDTHPDSAQSMSQGNPRLCPLPALSRLAPPTASFLPLSTPRPALPNSPSLPLFLLPPTLRDPPASSEGCCSASTDAHDLLAVGRESQPSFCRRLRPCQRRQKGGRRTSETTSRHDTPDNLLQTSYADSGPSVTSL